MSEYWKKEIINLLLDKYERTAAFQKGELPDRRVLLRFYDAGKTDFPAYDIDDHIVRTAINETVTAMQSEKLVGFEWMRGEQNHIIKRVWLDFSNLDKAYQIVNRQSAKLLVTAVIQELEQEIEAVNTDWIIAFYSEIKNYLETKCRLGSRLSSDKTERGDLYRMLRFIDSESFTSLTERVFSEKCFGASKVFESRMKPMLLSIMRKYVSRELSDAELLQMIGISRYPEPLELRGEIIINGNDMRVLQNGFCIYSNEIESADIIIPKTVERVLTIENRANFFAYQNKENELVVYHGGQYSQAKKRLFEMLAAAMQTDCQWYHWGDIDLGGFSMLLRLRTEILPTVQPYRMSVVELQNYRAFTQAFSKDYAEKLKKLKEQEKLSDCRDCIDYMLSNKVRLEQEAMLT